MHTRLADHHADSPEAARAVDLLKSCVHCGFCNAACPTYRLLGDELDGPRGRIYQIKTLLEGEAGAESLHRHLDRCLTCRACESSCPSGVEYGKILDIGREIAERDLPRPLWQRVQRRVLRWVLPFPRRFAPLVALARSVRAFLPARLRRAVPARTGAPGMWPAPRHARSVVMLRGCVQPVLAPVSNAAAARVLDRLGISVLEAPAAGCCGAMSHHLAASEEGLGFARRNVDAWYPLIEQGVEAIVSSASGCGLHLRAYGELLAGDAGYAERAARVSAAVRDLCELIEPGQLAAAAHGDSPRVAFHAPCTLQHGQRISGRVEALLRATGCELLPVQDAALCCGSAGSYSLLQPRLADELAQRKLRALQAAEPEQILSANVGCQLHLGARASVPVRHWIELVDERMQSAEAVRGG